MVLKFVCLNFGRTNFKSMKSKNLERNRKFRFCKFKALKSESWISRPLKHKVPVTILRTLDNLVRNGFTPNLDLGCSFSSTENKNVLSPILDSPVHIWAGWPEQDRTGLDFLATSLLLRAFLMHQSSQSWRYTKSRPSPICWYVILNIVAT